MFRFRPALAQISTEKVSEPDRSAGFRFRFRTNEISRNRAASTESPNDARMLTKKAPTKERNDRAKVKCNQVNSDLGELVVWLEFLGPKGNRLRSNGKQTTAKKMIKHLRPVNLGYGPGSSVTLSDEHLFVVCTGSERGNE